MSYDGIFRELDRRARDQLLSRLLAGSGGRHVSPRPRSFDEIVRNRLARNTWFCLAKISAVMRSIALRLGRGRVDLLPPDCAGAVN